MTVKATDVKVSELTDTVSAINEKLIGTEMAVKDTDVKVSELTDAVMTTESHTPGYPLCLS